MLYEIEKWNLISKKMNYNVYHIGFNDVKNPVYIFISDDNYNFILNNYTIEQFNKEELCLNQAIIIEKDNNIIFCDKIKQCCSCKHINNCFVCVEKKLVGEY